MRPATFRIPATLAAIALAAGCLGTAAPAETQAPPAAEAAPAPAGTPPPALTPAPRNIGGPGDYSLREKLVKALSRDGELSRTGISVVLVNGGVVYSGTVPTWTVRRRALLIASAMRGVINVTDQMEIPRGAVKDADIAKAISGLLQEQAAALGLQDLKVEVADAVATLSGTARDFAARVRAEEVAGTVGGVTRVVNRIRPANAPSGGDDTGVRHAIAKYLMDFREYPYSGDMEIEVRDGRAVLTGSVPLYLARQQAGTMLALVGGVREAVNLLEVDPSIQEQGVMVKEKP